MSLPREFKRHGRHWQKSRHQKDLSDLPQDLDFVYDLRNAVNPGNGRLRQLLKIKAGNLAPQDQPHVAIFAPDSLNRQMRMALNAFFRSVKDLAGLRFAVERVQYCAPLVGPFIRTLILLRRVVAGQEACLAKSAN